MTYSYSTDEENFIGHFATADHAAETAFDDFPDIDSVWIGENKKQTAHDFVHALDIIESIAEIASDECGECSEYWLDGLLKNKEKRDELKRLIGDWLEKNEPVYFYTVENEKLYFRDNRDLIFLNEDEKSAPHKALGELNNDL